MLRSKKQLIVSVSLVAASALVYVNTLRNGFVYDDIVTIVKNDFIKNFDNLPKLFLRDAYFAQAREITYRPVVTFTYFIDYALYGLKPWGYHLTNILLHAINGALIYTFFTLLVRPSAGARLSGASIDKTFFLLIPFLFATHPVLTEAVNAISYREDLLVALFYLATLNLYLISRADYVAQRYFFVGMYVLSCLLYVFALLSKEMAVTLPLVVCCYELVYGKRDRAWRTILLDSRILGYVVIASAYIFLRSHYFYRPYGLDAWPLEERLLTAPYLLTGYLRLSAFPIHLSADYVISPVNILFSTRFIMSSIFVFFLIASILFTAKNRKQTAFGTLFFLMTLIPVYNIVPIPFPFSERYLYLPMIGFAIVIGSIVCEIAKGLGSRYRKHIIILISILMSINSFIIIQRNKVWKDGYSLWSDTLKKAPDSHRAHLALGNVFHEQGQMSEAIEQYKIAINLKPDFTLAHYNLGVAFYEQGRIDEAVRHYQIAIRLKPGYAEAHNNLGLARYKQGRVNDAIRHFQTAVRLNPGHLKARMNLASAYYEQGMPDKAREEYQAILRLRPDYFSKDGSGFRQPE